MTKAMWKRIVFGACMVVALLLVAWLEYRVSRPCEGAAWADYASLLRGLPTLAVVGILLVVGFFELDRMTQAVGTRLLRPAGLVCMLFLLAVPKLHQAGAALTTLWPGTPQTLGRTLETLLTPPLLIVALVGVVIFFNQMLTRRVEGALSRIAATLLAVTYLGVCGAMVLSLRMHFGLGMFLVFLAAVKLTDVGAYFVGSLFGKHKLIPWLSPGKSWEGLFGGLVMAAITALAACWIARNVWWFDYPLSLSKSVIFCVILGGFGQFGDLCESLLKRSAGVKDAGNLVPQFGGVLDIIDSPLIAAPVAHVLLMVM